MTEKIKPPKWFWVAAIVALLWNLMGVAAFLSQMFMTPEMLVEMSEPQRMALAANPTWFNVAYGTAVIAGALGCVALLLRNSRALLLFVISFAAILLQMIYSFLLTEHVTNYGPGEVFMPLMIIGIGVLLIHFARIAGEKGWTS